MDVLVVTVDDSTSDLRRIDTKHIVVFMLSFRVAVIAIAIVVDETTALTIFDEFFQF